MDEPAKITPPTPIVDHVKMATEIKKYIDKNKFDHVDYGFDAIEMWPLVVDNPELPESSAFAKQWNNLFDYAETLVVDEDGTGFPEELVKQFEGELKKVETAINEDKEFWDTIRPAVIDLYRDMKTNSIRKGWENRWKYIKLWYDPIGMVVSSTQLFKNKAGAVVERKEISKRTIPAGFVIKVF